MTQPDRRQIELHLDVDSISIAGASERYQRGATPHTIFAWWARRPFAAARQLVTLSAPISDRATTPNRGTQTRVLDPFSGGSTFALTAAQLGMESHAVENNQLAHFIGLALLQLSQGEPRLAKLVADEGRLLLQTLAAETEQLFPARATDEVAEAGHLFPTKTTDGVMAYFWSRSVTCKCEAALSLQKRPWLSRKSGRETYIHRSPDRSTKSYAIELQSGEDIEDSHSAWNGRASIECPFCGMYYKGESLRDLVATRAYDELTAVALMRRPKEYKLAGEQHDLSAPEEVEQVIVSDLDAIGDNLPTIVIPQWSGITNPTLYGHTTVDTLFTRRQLAVMIRLARLIRERYATWESIYGAPRAGAIAAFLSGLLDQLADWNSRVSMWIPQNEQVGRGLSGPGLPMLWDFVEIDPLQSGPANLWDKLDRIVAGIRSIPQFVTPQFVTRGDARALPYPDDYFDAVVTDPPYYDNIFYSVFADCIYAFKRLALRTIFPAEFGDPATDRTAELSASRDRTTADGGGPWEYFSSGMAAALSEARRVLKRDGVITLCYAHSTLEGWCSLVAAYVQAKLTITKTWPISIEREQRPRAMRSAAVNTSVVLVARPDTSSKANTAPSSKSFQQVVREVAARGTEEAWPDDVTATMCLLGGLEAALREAESDEISRWKYVAPIARKVAAEVTQLYPLVSFPER